MRKPKSCTLRQTAAPLFVLTGVLPLLMFSYALVRLNGLRKFQDQITLGLLGFHILRVVKTRMPDLLRAVGQATEKGEVPALAPDRDLRVPGIGPIQEFREIGKAVDHLWALWKAEAAPYVGRWVLVSVRNSPHPIAGTLVEVTDDGVLLEGDAQQVAVSYRSVSAIEARSAASPAQSGSTVPSPYPVVR